MNACMQPNNGNDSEGKIGARVQEQSVRSNAIELFVIELAYITIFLIYSPVRKKKMVIKTKRVKYMPFTLSFANFCNGIVWLIYALLKLDPYILVPNGLGSLIIWVVPVGIVCDLLKENKLGRGRHQKIRGRTLECLIDQHVLASIITGIVCRAT
ncbi:hypothetical protein Q3G72_005383 [Acer saccharum]|nr:hypothetical protein Q3G72_004413 [Acer saccharum]KAK1549149.1 hypothetical protein Q3G72_005383 [Acer saccharum]